MGLGLLTGPLGDSDETNMSHVPHQMGEHFCTLGLTT